MPDMQSRSSCSLMANVFFSRLQLLILLAAAGCNPYRAPQTIAPETELKMSEESIAIRSGMLRIPKGWTMDPIEHYDDKGCPIEVHLVRSDQRGQIASMLLASLNEHPAWRGNGDVHETSTRSHDRVVYGITSMRAPSWNGESGEFAIDAYAKQGPNTFWYMHLCFFTPVCPDLLEAVNYIDAVGQMANGLPCSPERSKSHTDLIKAM